MPAEEKVTWGEVCKQVGFKDNLYRTCREKVTDWKPTGFANGAFDEVPEPDFTRRLSKTAVAIPKPPGPGDEDDEDEDEDEEDEEDDEGMFFGLPVQKLLVYGGVAAVAYFLLMRKNATPATAPKTATATSSTTAAARAA
jgi:hypothetical protein